MPISRRKEAYNKPGQECPATNGSSHIPLFDRDRLNVFSQVPLRLQRIPYVGYECYGSSHQACCPLLSNSEIWGKSTGCITVTLSHLWISQKNSMWQWKRFCNKNMETFCKNNGITMKHGAPRTPTTQGLIERSNRSCKEDMHTLIVSTAEKDSNWCRKLGEISYIQTYLTTLPFRQLRMKQFTAWNLTGKCYSKAYKLRLRAQTIIWNKPS